MKNAEGFKFMKTSNIVDGSKTRSNFINSSQTAPYSSNKNWGTSNNHNSATESYRKKSN